MVIELLDDDERVVYKLNNLTFAIGKNYLNLGFNDIDILQKAIDSLPETGGAIYILDSNW